MIAGLIDDARRFGRALRRRLCLFNVDVIVPLMHTWKKEARLRYVGVTHHEPAYFAVLTEWLERGTFAALKKRIAERMEKNNQGPRFVLYTNELYAAVSARSLPQPRTAKPSCARKPAFRDKSLGISRLLL